MYLTSAPRVKKLKQVFFANVDQYPHVIERVDPRRRFLPQCRETPTLWNKDRSAIFRASHEYVGDKLLEQVCKQNHFKEFPSLKNPTVVLRVKPNVEREYHASATHFRNSAPWRKHRRSLVDAWIVLKR